MPSGHGAALSAFALSDAVVDHEETPVAIAYPFEKKRPRFPEA
jgi:hypothetical protein